MIVLNALQTIAGDISGTTTTTKFKNWFFQAGLDKTPVDATQTALLDPLSTTLSCKQMQLTFDPTQPQQILTVIIEKDEFNRSLDNIIYYEVGIFQDNLMISRQVLANGLVKTKESSLKISWILKFNNQIYT